jgi:hypothetical protein
LNMTLIVTVTPFHLVDYSWLPALQAFMPRVCNLYIFVIHHINFNP